MCFLGSGRNLKGIERLVAQLGSRNEKEREMARELLREMGPETVPQLLEIQAREGRRRKQQQKWTTGTFIGFILIMVLVAVKTGHWQFFSNFGSFTSFLGLAAASQMQKNTAKALSAFEDKRTVGALIEALEYQDKDVASNASAALMKLLPTLNASDASLLNQAQRHILNKMLAGKNIPLSLVILKALEQVGDSQALLVVEKLARGEGRAAKNADLKQAAADCLPFLQLRAEQERSRTELLRAADGNLTPAEQLLRPASEAGATDPADLLRASQSEAPAVNEAYRPLVARNGQRTNPSEETDQQRVTLS